MANKRYYWLKLDEHFFKSNGIKIIKKMTDGYKYIVLYLEMMLLSINSNGNLYVSDGVAFDAELLSYVVDMDTEDVEAALRVFEKLKLIERDNATIRILNFDNMVGSETADAERMRRKRSNKTEHCSVLFEHCSTDIDKDIDTEKEKDIDIETEGEKEKEAEASFGTHSGKNNFENSFDNIPSLDDVKVYALERGSAVDCEKFYDHYSAVGWLMGKTPIKDWKAAFRKWEKTEKVPAPPSASYSYSPKPKQVSAPAASEEHYDKNENSSFDTDDFFMAALRRSYGDISDESLGYLMRRD